MGGEGRGTGWQMGGTGHAKFHLDWSTVLTFEAKTAILIKI